MKSIIVAILFLTACQSTAPKITVNIESNEQQLSRNIEFLKSEISLGNKDKRYNLALSYSASFDQNKRKLAKPLLEQLVEEKHIDATVFLAQMELLGWLGYVSNRLFTQYDQIIKDNDPKVFQNFEDEKAEMENVLELHFSSMKQFYDQNNYLCEQPLEQPINHLEKNSNTYLVVKYFNQCLQRYSIQNSKQRLQAMSKFQAIVCSTIEENKTCISEGYDALSMGLTSIDESLVVAAALRKIYKSHKTMLRKKTGVQKRSASSKTGKVLIKALNAYEANDLDKSSQSLISYINNTKQLSAYDKAYIEKFLVHILFSQDRKLAIEYANKALNSNELSYKEHSELFDVLSDIYFDSEEYAKYISMIGNYILENQGDMDLIPMSSTSESSNTIVNK